MLKETKLFMKIDFKYATFYSNCNLIKLGKLLSMLWI